MACLERSAGFHYLEKERLGKKILFFGKCGGKIRVEKGAGRREESTKHEEGKGERINLLSAYVYSAIEWTRVRMYLPIIAVWYLEDTTVKAYFPFVSFRS